MKRIMLFWVVLLLTLSVSNAWAEKYHTVAKGECLSIIGSHYNVNWKNIQKVNRLTSTTIHPGQKLVIPGADNTTSVVNNSVKHVAEKHVAVGQPMSRVAGHTVRYSSPYWTKPGGNPFRAKLSEGLKIFKFNSEEVAGMVDEANNGKPVYAYAQHISRGGLIIAENGKKYRPLVMLSGGKGNSPIDVKTGPNGVINNWPDKKQLQGGEIYTDGRNSIMIYYKCDNPTLLIEVEQTDILKPHIEIVTNTNIANRLSVFPGISPAQAQAKMKNRDNFDWLAGNGDYVSRLAGNDNHGDYFWSKARGRFFWLDYDGQKISIGIGVFGFIAGGHGKADKYYKYGWDEKVLGVTAKILAEHKDVDIDVGAGTLRNHGRWKNDATNRQRDSIYLVSLHGNFYARRDRGELWFPKFELNLEGRFPFNTKVYHGEKTNNQSINFMYTQWIYDYKVNGDNSLVIDPGFNLGFGYEWSSPDHPAYLQVGPTSEISSYGNTLSDVSLVNYKFQGNGQILPYGFFISLDGLWNAWQASQVTEATAADLENLPANGESKLLHNPANYLK